MLRQIHHLLVAVLFALGTCSAAYAATSTVSATPAAEDGSLAQYKVVIQSSTGTAANQKLVLNNAANLIKALGPDKVAIDIVAYGPGLRLLFKNNVNAKRIQSLAAQGVHFKACHNTMNHMHKTKADLNPVAEVVPAGVLWIIQREAQGWAYVRP